MPFSVRCEGCKQEISVPDHLSGQTVSCPICKMQFEALPPLMPPTMPGAESDSNTQTPTAASAGGDTAAPSLPVANPASAAPLPTSNRPPAPAPPGQAGTPAGPSGPLAEPQHTGASPVALPPVKAPFPPVHPPVDFPASPATAAPTGVVVQQATDRAKKMKKPNTLGWALTAVCLIGILILVIVTVMERRRLNPPISEVAERFEVAERAIRKLGNRQTGAGYSFLLPSSFVPVASPSSSGLPDGTISCAWKAPQRAPHAGSELRLWVIPDELNIRKALLGLTNLEGRLDYPTLITQKSDHRRIGNDIIAVAARLDGSSGPDSRKGVIYIMYDTVHKKTLLLIGMGVGKRHAEVQYLLDHSARTVRFEG